MVERSATEPKGFARPAGRGIDRSRNRVLRLTPCYAQQPVPCVGVTVSGLCAFSHPGNELPDILLVSFIILTEITDQILFFISDGDQYVDRHAN